MVSSGCRDALLDFLSLASRGAYFPDKLDLALQDCEAERKNYLWKEYKEVPLY